MQISQSVALTDVGQRMSQNEDAVRMLPAVPLFIVADGTGGTGPAPTCLAVLERHAAALGELGRRVATSPDTTARLAVGRFFEDVLGEAGRAVKNAAAARASASEDDGPTGASAEAATLVAGTVMGRFAYIAHVGNARAYLLRQGRLRCLTIDHTLAMQQLRRGEITVKEFAASPYRKTLTQALGATPSVHPDIAEVQIAPGDVFMLCSDGLHRAVTDREMARVLAAGDDLDAAAARLVALANEAGGKDNISVALFRVETPEEDAGSAPVDIMRALGQVFLFRDLSEAERLLVAPYFEHRTFDAGAALCREGDIGDSFFVIVSGKVDVTHGPAKLIELGPGSYAGEIALAREGLRTATLTARKTTEALVLTRARFLELIRRRPRLGARLVMPLLANVGDRIVDLRSRLHTIGVVISGADADDAL